MAPLPTVGAPSSPPSGSGGHRGADARCARPPRSGAAGGGGPDPVRGRRRPTPRLRRQLARPRRGPRSRRHRWVHRPPAVDHAVPCSPWCRPADGVPRRWPPSTPSSCCTSTASGRGTAPPAPAAAPGTPTPGAATLPPTQTMSVTAVVVNRRQRRGGRPGRAGPAVPAEPHGPSAVRSRRVSLVPGGVGRRDLPRFASGPGSTYVLSVSVSPPAGQLDRRPSGALTRRGGPAQPADDDHHDDPPPATDHRSTRPRLAHHRRGRRSAQCDRDPTRRS